MALEIMASTGRSENSDGSVVSDDIALYSISPGRAFVKGYDVKLFQIPC